MIDLHRYRANALLGIEFFWTLGTFFVAAIAWLSLDALGWRFLACACAVPGAQKLGVYI